MRGLCDDVCKYSHCGSSLRTFADVLRSDATCDITCIGKYPCPGPYIDDASSSVIKCRETLHHVVYREQPSHYGHSQYMLSLPGIVFFESVQSRAPETSATNVVWATRALIGCETAVSEKSKMSPNGPVANSTPDNCAAQALVGPRLKAPGQNINSSIKP